MSADNVSSVSTDLSSDTHNSRSQRHQDFIALATALNASDLAGAQAAFAAFQKDIKNTSGTNGGSRSSQESFHQQRNDRFQSLAQALSSGKLATAQKAFSAFRQASQNLFLARNNWVSPSDSVASADKITAAGESAGDGSRDRGSSVSGVKFSA